MNTNLYNSHITTQEEWDAQKAEYMRRPAAERAQLELEPTLACDHCGEETPIRTMRHQYCQQCATGQSAQP